ncbi:MAG: hypothetical protein V4697_03445 [Patescibacteria group bacterium]
MNEEHPLHILDNQVAPEDRPKVILQKPIRTYESDVADAMARKKTSVVTMAIAEAEKKTGNESISNKQPSYAGRKILIVLVSLIFIAVGLGGAYYLYLQSPLAPTSIAPVTMQIPSLVTPDSQKLLPLTNLSREQILGAVQSAYEQSEGEVGKIYEFIPTQNSGSSTLRMTAGEFIDSIYLNMPDTVKRSLTEAWMLGIYGSEAQKVPFIIFKTDFFQNAYAGMLGWEGAMPEQMADVLGYRQRAETNRDSGTSTIASYFAIKGRFEDRIIRNRDVREFRDDTGDLLFLYAFLDESTLVIATSESVLGALIDRIDKQTYIR